MINNYRIQNTVTTDKFYHMILNLFNLPHTESVFKTKTNAI